MKKKLTMIGLLGFTFLFGYTQTQNEAGADSKDGAEIIEIHDDVDWGLHQVKHQETGCYYMLYTDTQNSSITQMLDKDGLPYCEEGSE